MKVENILIRNPKKSDIDQLLIYVNKLSKEKTYVNFQGFEISRKYEIGYLNDLIEKIKKQEAVAKFMFYGNTFIGSAAITMSHKKTSKEHVGTFGISVDKKYRGKGFGSKLMDEVLKEGKFLTGIQMIHLEAFNENTLAVEMYKKKGFIQYGLLPNGVKRKGALSDEILMYKMI